MTQGSRGSDLKQTRARAGKAAKLVWGEFNTSSCPAGAYVIVDEAQCHAAAATAGKGWFSSESDATEPRGCYWYTDNRYVALNTHPTGAASPYAQLLCAVLPATGVCIRA